MRLGRRGLCIGPRSLCWLKRLHVFSIAAIALTLTILKFRQSPRQGVHFEVICSSDIDMEVEVSSSTPLYIPRIPFVAETNGDQQKDGQTVGCKPEAPPPREH